MKTVTRSATFALAIVLAGCAAAPSRLATPAAPAYIPPVTAPATLNASAALAAAAATVTNPRVGGAAMLGTRTIADNCAAAPNLRTLSRAIASAETRSTLAAPGPITVFAPTDQAFDRLAVGAVDQLLALTNRPTLQRLVAYHVVPGAITLDQLRARVAASGGAARLTTVEGDPLTVTRDGEAVVLTDVNGNKSFVETPDVQQTNGIVHVVNGVLVPRLG
ncbi:fasciclin domain-containing protein [Sphingomonas sp. NBWT7]|uniref:fasciclin domain-containing protein n=1 Tax=Sphingomonas sp. NBWT7 TaxID=2596913 RepID=UPI0016276541|nr:fasciclin domain-containing protein [Sphingomonas sp. NBWT7]QNE31279.1 fasciclin domain-containing protein [Sphingomonas sp. NBWT7]